MLDFNCLLKNTQLLQDISRYLEKTVLSRASKNEKVDIESIYSAMRKEGSFWDLDMNSVAYIYENAIPALKQSGVKGLSSQRDIDAATNKIIDKEVKKILFAKRQVKTEEVGRQKPSEAGMTALMQMFEADMGISGNVVRKTDMKQLQDAVEKAGKALLDRKNRVKPTQPTFIDILKEAFRLDELSIKGLNGTMNNLDDLFNQMVDEADRVVARMEAQKKGQSQAKIAEIDDKIRRFRAYTAKIQQGAYTLALSQGEAKKVMLDILKEKHGKNIIVNGKTKRVIQWNKVFKEVNGVPDLEKDVEEVLRKNGFSPTQIQRISEALAVQYDNLRQSAQWQNLADNGMSKAVNDDTFLTRAANAVIMSKTDKEGQKYSVYDPEIGRNVPDLARWVADGNPDITTLKSKIADDIRSKNDASGYRQIVSELARAEQKIPKVTKSDLEKLNELKKINGFDEKFNAKVYSMLGLQQSDIEAADQIEKILETVDKVLQEGGERAIVSLNTLQNAITAIINLKGQDKTSLFTAAVNFQKFMTIRNAYRLMNIYNIVENTQSGVTQIVQNQFTGLNPKNKKERFKKSISVLKDVAKGGQQYRVYGGGDINLLSHEHRVDPNKSFAGNINAYMNTIPNFIMGSMDSMAYQNTFQTMFENSLIKYAQSSKQLEFEKRLTDVGETPAEARKKALKPENQKKFFDAAVDEVNDALYDEAKRAEALRKAEQLLKLAKESPTKEEIEREADNLMFDELLGAVDLNTKKRKGGVVNQDILQAIIKGADEAARIAIGKQMPFLNPNSWLPQLQADSRKKIQKLIKEGKYNRAASKIFWSSVLYQGIFPFASSAFNWTVIKVKKAGLGFVSAYKFRKKDFRKELERIGEMDAADVKETLAKYNRLRDDIHKPMLELAYTFLFYTIVTAFYAAGADDDEEYDEFMKEQIKELNEIPFAKKALQRWVPDMVAVGNAVAGNYGGDYIRDFSGIIGLGTLDNPLEKALNFNRKHPAAAFGSVIGSAFDVGSFYSMWNSYLDIFDKETPKGYAPKAHDPYFSPLEPGSHTADFINGIIFGMIGYGLNKDLNNWYNYRPSK